MEAHPFDGINLRDRPGAYRIGRGEYGLFHAQPYKDELLPLWAFRTPEVARESANRIYERYRKYREEEDFVGMDLARKYLQMGYTRARRYAKYPGGRKYDSDGQPLPVGELDADKQHSAMIFKEFWDRVREDPAYIRAKKQWKQQYE